MLFITALKTEGTTQLSFKRYSESPFILLLIFVFSDKGTEIVPSGT